MTIGEGPINGFATGQEVFRLTIWKNGDELSFLLMLKPDGDADFKVSLFNSTGIGFLNAILEKRNNGYRMKIHSINPLLDNKGLKQELRRKILEKIDGMNSAPEPNTRNK